MMWYIVYNASDEHKGPHWSRLVQSHTTMGTHSRTCPHAGDHRIGATVVVTYFQRLSVEAFTFVNRCVRLVCAQRPNIMSGIFFTCLQTNFLKFVDRYLTQLCKCKSHVLSSKSAMSFDGLQTNMKKFVDLLCRLACKKFTCLTLQTCIFLHVG